MGSIDRRTLAGNGLRQLARRQITEFSAELQSALDGGGVHSARKRLKFIRSLLRMLRSAIGEIAFANADQHAKAAAKGLAGPRKGEAMVEAIDGLQDGNRGEPVLKGLREAAQHYGASTGVDLRPAIQTAHAEMELMRSLISSWPLPNRDPQLFLTGIRTCYRRARRTLVQGLDNDDGELLHEARKSVIHHLHHVTILTPLWPRLFPAWCCELDRLRSSLGDYNDLGDLDAMFRAPGSPFYRLACEDWARIKIGKRRRDLVQVIARRSTRLFAERPQALERRLSILWTQNTYLNGSGRQSADWAERTKTVNITDAPDDLRTVELS